MILPSIWFLTPSGLTVSVALSGPNRLVVASYLPRTSRPSPFGPELRSRPPGVRVKPVEQIPGRLDQRDRLRLGIGRRPGVIDLAGPVAARFSLGGAWPA